MPIDEVISVGDPDHVAHHVALAAAANAASGTYVSAEALGIYQAERYATLNLAVAAAGAAGGGVVYLPVGATPVAARVDVPSRVIIKGAGEGAQTVWGYDADPRLF